MLHICWCKDTNYFCTSTVDNLQVINNFNYLTIKVIQHREEFTIFATVSIIVYLIHYTTVYDVQK